MSSSSGSNSNKSKSPGISSQKGDGVLPKISLAPPTNSASQSSSSSSSTSSSSTTNVRALKSRKENLIPGVASTANNSHSSSPSMTAGSTEMFAAKDIDRIAKYKADRRKPIYLRNTVQENEIERLDNRKKSTSRSATNTPTSSAIHSKSQSSTLHHSKASTSPSASAWASSRPWRATSAGSSSTSSTSAASSGSVAGAKPRPSPTAASSGGSGGGTSSLPLSPLHQSQKLQLYQPRKSRDRSNVRAAKPEVKQVAAPQQQVKQQQQQQQPQQAQPQQPIRTTRSSRLRAAALTGGVGTAVPSTGEDAHQQRLKASAPAAPSSGGIRKLFSSSRNSPTVNAGNRASTILATATKPRDSVPKPKLVPTITAVSMKQKLKGITETISKLGAADINRNNKSPAMANRTNPATNNKTDLMNGNAPTNTNNNPEPIQVATVSGGEAFLQRIPSTTASGANGEGIDNFQLPRRSPQLDSIVEHFSSMESPPTPRMRTSTMKSGVRTPLPEMARDMGGLSPVRSNGSGSRLVERDKSAKRKSNLNRAQHEESTESRNSSTDRHRLRSKSGNAHVPIASPEALAASSKNATSPPSTTVATNDNVNTTRTLPSPSPAPAAIATTRIPSKIVRKSPHSPSGKSASPTTSPGPLSSSSSSPTTATKDLISTLSLQSPVTSIDQSLATAASPALSMSISTPSPVMSFESSLSRISPSPVPSSSRTALVDESSSSSGTLAATEELQRDRSNLVDVRVDSKITGAEQQEEEMLPESPLPVVSPYSKFSQMLKSPTLEKHGVRVPAIVPSPLELEMVQPEVEEEMERGLPEEVQEEVPLIKLEQETVNKLEQEEQILDQSQELMVPLDLELKDEVRGNVEQTDVDFMEAGPSGLCPIVHDKDEDDVDDEEEELATNRLLLMRDVRRSRSSSPRRTNRILFDDKFNDEFVVIENSPKSHFIQSLDETDIIVIGDNDEDYPPRPASSNSAGAGSSYEKKLVKMSSVEHFEHLQQRKSCSPQRKKSLSPIIRAKSMEESHMSSSNSPASNHIVSILKRKTVESNSSASSNASPVTFSPSVVDTPSRSTRRQGILKKRCSLDESRYSRSHSPDDRSILVKHTRRNSFEDGSQHGILKQKSYESKEDFSASAGGGSGSSTAVNSVVSHGILKKKTDSSSTSTPNEQQKHVSISQAVILAVAEICQDMLLDNEYDREIRPILKSDLSQPPSTPKPILKKKYSSESEEIRPILKSSRKSSREENSDSDELKRSILKTDSPAKRRSFGDRDSSDSSGAMIRSRSLEHSEPVPLAPIVPQVQNIEKPIISVAERIKHMEKFLAAPTSSGSASTSGSGNTSAGAVPKRCANSRRETFRFKTQPVTSNEISGVQQQQQQLQHTDHRSVDNPEESVSSEEPVSFVQTEDEPIVCGTAESVCLRGSLESLIYKAKLQSEDKSSELLSPTFAHTESNTHSFSGEFNLASLSSDSGIQFGRGTEETSGAEYVSSVKTSDSDKSPSKKTIDDDLNELDEEEDDVGGEEHLEIIEETEGQKRILLSPSSAAAAIAAQDRRRSGSSSCSSSSDLSDREIDRMYAATTVSGSKPDDDQSSGLRRSNSVRARANMFQQMESRMKENENPAALSRGRRVMPTGGTSTQFAKQTISPTDIDRSIQKNLNTSNLISQNNVSDDSGTEFDPSTLQVSKKIKLFSGGGDQDAGRGGVITATITTPTGTQVPKKKFKFRTIGKLIIPKFLNDNNNNISNSATNTPPAAEAMPISVTTPDMMDGGIDAKNGDGNHLNCSKIDRLRRKFMVDSSTPIIEDEECDSNVESGKENNYDSGAELNLSLEGVTALKRNFVNENRSHNKSILFNSSAEVEELVGKGKVSNMAKQWNRMRSMTLDVSAINKVFNPAALDTANLTCHSLPYEGETKLYNSNNSSIMCRSSSFKSNSSKIIENRFACYFGLNLQPSQNPVATVAPNNSQQDCTSAPNSKSRRPRSVSRGNPPAPPPQRPVDERIAKYFGINKSFSGCGSPRTALINKPRAIVKPQQRLLDPASAGTAQISGGNRRRRSRSMPREMGSIDELDKLLNQSLEKDYGVSLSFCLASGVSSAVGKVTKLRYFEELNITAEDLSMADSEFDKLYLD